MVCAGKIRSTYWPFSDVLAGQRSSSNQVLNMSSVCRASGLSTVVLVASELYSDPPAA